MSGENLYQSLFTSLVYTFHMTALQQLGRVVNPLTQQKEQDFEQAKLTIDMIIMLKEKTSGNLTEEEEKFLNQTLAQLKKYFSEALAKNVPSKL